MFCCAWRLVALAVVFLTGGLWAAALTGCGPGAHADTLPKAKKNEPEVTKAEVITIQPTVWPATVRAHGSLIADEVTIVGSQVAGRVNRVNVDLGDVVKAGAPLATLDQEDFRLQVSLAEAQLRQARAALGLKDGDPVESLDPENAPPVREAKALWEEARARIARVRQLQVHARNTVTQEEYDQAVAAEGAAAARHAAAINGVKEKIVLISVRESEWAVARQRLSETIVYAPYDALVQERHVGNGAYVQVGDPVATLVRTNTLRFHGTVPERSGHRLAVGQKVTLRIEGTDQPRVAQMTRISPRVEEMSRSLTFEATLDNRDGSLRTGLFAEAEVEVDPHATAIVVPSAAIVAFAGAEKVWKLVDGMAKEQVVITSRRAPFGIEVTKGLAPGEVILARSTDGRVGRIEPIYVAPPVAEEPAGDAGVGVAGEEQDPAAGEATSLGQTHRGRASEGEAVQPLALGHSVSR